MLVGKCGWKNYLVVEKLIWITFPKLSNVLRVWQILTCWRGQVAICKEPWAPGRAGVVGCGEQHISGAGWLAGRGSLSPLNLTVLLVVSYLLLIWFQTCANSWGMHVNICYQQSWSFSRLYFKFNIFGKQRLKDRTLPFWEEVEKKLSWKYIDWECLSLQETMNLNTNKWTEQDSFSYISLGVHMRVDARAQGIVICIPSKINVLKL